MEIESATSGSHRSSSCGGDDDDFTSRVDSVSAFFRSGATAVAVPQQLVPSQQLVHSPGPDSHHHFDHFPSLPYLDSSTRTPLPLQSVRGAESQQSSSSPSEQPVNQAAAELRGSKKRSRASRRAPTTVITTDASNFRAMVQEFTGISSLPFTSTTASSSHAVRPRLEIFNSPQAAAASPPFLLRPSPQKVPCFADDANASSIATENNSQHQEQIQSFVFPHQIPAINFQSLIEPSLFREEYGNPNMATNNNAERLLTMTTSAVYGAIEHGGLAPGLVRQEPVRSTWMGGAGSGQAQLRHSMVGNNRVDGSSKQNNSGTSSLEIATLERLAVARARASGQAMMDSWFHSPE